MMPECDFEWRSVNSLFRGFYTAASGMVAQQRQQEALSNNIANANTPGYKSDQATMRAFPEMLMKQMNAKIVPTEKGMQLPEQQTIGPLNTGVYMQEAIPDFEQGDIRETGNDTDLALIEDTIPDETGGLFFTVQNDAGESRFTRNGNFTIDEDRFLVTNHGYYVLDQNDNPIQTDGTDPTVSEDGLVQTESDTIPLGIAYSGNVNQLEKEGNGLYDGDTGDIPDDASFQIKQGFLERSNVDASQAMTDKMESYRSFETNQRVLKAYDESMDKAVNNIARLS